MKTPFNWVGNKYNYMDKINSVIEDKKYRNVIDMFMGSGNIFLNASCGHDNIIANDKIKLLPMLYEEIRLVDEDFSLDEVNAILLKWCMFSKKEDYYEFRKHWNKKYKEDNFDREFIIETSLLLKMCSNSMVRFNKSGEFNQGFRGLGDKKEFFGESMKTLIVNGLNSLRHELNKMNVSFNVGDVRDMKFSNDDLLIIDPPYILRQDMYCQDFTIQHDDYLLNIIKENKVDFIYFNYIHRDDITHSKLHEALSNNKELRVIELSNKTKSGQGSTGSKQIREVMITNIKE